MNDDKNLFEEYFLMDVDDIRAENKENEEIYRSLMNKVDQINLLPTSKETIRASSLWLNVAAAWSQLSSSREKIMKIDLAEFIVATRFTECCERGGTPKDREYKKWEYLRDVIGSARNSANNNLREDEERYCEAVSLLPEYTTK